MRILPAMVFASVGFAVVTAGCRNKCDSWPCAAGFRPDDDTCICRPLNDAAADDGRGDASAVDSDTDDAAMLASCGPAASGCGGGSTCIDGCPASHFPDAGSVGGVCSVPGRDTCGCGAVLDTCATAGTTCLMPACCDYPGVCVTPAERAEICARPESIHFDCMARFGP